ncbi:MAG: hypothetical protein RLZZ546_3000, partial [Bacteroidota bacterium]
MHLFKNFDKKSIKITSPHSPDISNA